MAGCCCHALTYWLVLCAAQEEPTAATCKDSGHISSASWQQPESQAPSPPYVTAGRVSSQQPRSATEAETTKVGQIPSSSTHEIAGADGSDARDIEARIGAAISAQSHHERGGNSQHGAALEDAGCPGAEEESHHSHFQETDAINAALFEFWPQRSPADCSETLGQEDEVLSLCEWAQDEELACTK